MQAIIDYREPITKLPAVITDLESVIPPTDVACVWIMRTAGKTIYLNPNDVAMVTVTED